jgi:autotransporter-associated beta strand protein
MTSGYASEGPSTIKIGNNWIVYNDHYGSGVYGAMMSADGMATWSEYTGYVAFPSGTRHGNVFTVPYSVAKNLAANAPSKPSEDEFVDAAGTTNFHTASNWFAGTVPGANQTPVIQGGYAADMNSSPSGAFSGLKVGQTSVGTLHINNAAAVVVTSAWPNGLVLGERVTGNGTIVQSESSSVTVNGYASIGARGTGVYRLQGGSLTINGDLNVGDILGGHGDLYQANGTIAAPSLYVGSGWAGGFTTGNCVGGVHQSGGVFTVTGSGDSVVIGGRDNAYGIGAYELTGGNFSAGNNANIFIGKYGQGSFTQTGGTVAAGQWLSIGRYAGSIGSYSIGNGALNQTNASTRIIVGEQGTGTLSVGGGLIDCAGGLRIGMNYGGTVGSGEVHLDGGTILTPVVEDGGGNSVFHFNGGTLKARSATAAFMQNLDLSDVQAGGAVIDTNGFNVTIAQPLLAGSITGGLTKSGLGVLTLTSPPSYMGDTLIEAGSLQMNFAAATLHNISGAGNLIVAGSTQLTAASIRVGTLTIGGSAAAVPEPSMTVLTAMGLLIAAALGWRWKKSSP